MISAEVCISASVWVCDTWFPNQSHTHAIVRAASIKRVCVYVHMCKRKKERERRVTELLKSPVLLAAWYCRKKKEAERWRLWPSWFSARWQSSVWLQVRAAQQHMLGKLFIKTAVHDHIISSMCLKAATDLCFTDLRQRIALNLLEDQTNHYYSYFSSHVWQIHPLAPSLLVTTLLRRVRSWFFTVSSMLH